MNNDFENTLDDIRIKLNEQTKGMTNKDVADFMNANAKKLAEQYGMKLVKTTPVRPSNPHK